MSKLEDVHVIRGKEILPIHIGYCGRQELRLDFYPGKQSDFGEYSPGIAFNGSWGSHMQVPKVTQLSSSHAIGGMATEGSSSTHYVLSSFS